MATAIHFWPKTAPDTKTLPPDHPHEAPRQKRRGRRNSGRACRIFPRSRLPGLAPRPRIIDTFGAKNVYVELQRHFNRNQEAHNQALIDFARSRNLPLLATNGVSHATPQSREALDVLTCVRNKVTIHEAGRLLSLNSERYLKDARQMAASSATSRKPSPTPANFPIACSSRSPISATSSPNIRSRPAKP